MTTCGIIQSNYLPWRGYFDLIHDCDVFVFHDDIQYTKQDWRNRNLIKSPKGTQWLTVPVGHVATDTLIQDVNLSTNSWADDHLKLIKQCYEKAEFYKAIFKLLTPILKQDWKKLSQLNITLIKEISQFLGIKTKMLKSSELDVTGKKTDRIISICKQVDADHYLSGPKAKAYLDTDKLTQSKIKLSYKEYNYPNYPQLFGPFEAQVSVIDLLFNCGESAAKAIWGDKETYFEDPLTQKNIA